MVTKNFTQFNTATPLSTTDFIVGYKGDGTAEIKTQVQDIINLVGESDSQTLSFNKINNELTISSGNTVSLSSLSDTAFANLSGSFATNTDLNAISSVLTPLTLTKTLTGQLITNSDFANYQTSVAGITATLLPTTVYENTSGSFATNSFVQNTFFPLSGGIITGSTRINSDLTVFGNLTATGTTTFANTVFSVTSSLSVVHIGAGPALWVGNNGTGDIASFYDIDQNIEVLHVGGENGTFPNVGVKTSTPNKAFTVVGEISATQDITNTGKIFTTGGNSDQWNAARVVTTTYQTVSSSFATNTTVNTLTGQLTPLTTTTTLTGQLTPLTVTNTLTGLLTPLTVTNTLTSQLATVVQAFTSSSTWNKPAGARSIHVAIIGGGGGGGSGRYDGPSTARGGGSGGGAGSFTQLVLNADVITGPVTVTVGAGGSGGAAQTILAIDGNPGTPGGISKFGIYGQSTGGSGGAGGTAATLTTRTAAGVGMHNGGDGGVGQVGTSSANRPGGNAVAAGGGGGGGGCSIGNTNSQGGDGGVSFIMELAGGAGGLTNGGPGGAGNSAGINQPTPGTGGGGGGGGNITNGGAGGNGGNYGGGGGGGAGSNGTQSGPGGNGANGIVVVTTYF